MPTAVDDLHSEQAPGVKPAGSHELSASQAGQGAERSGALDAIPSCAVRKRDLMEQINDGNSDSADQLKKQLHTVTDEKETKRIKRYAPVRSVQFVARQHGSF